MSYKTSNLILKPSQAQMVNSIKGFPNCKILSNTKDICICNESSRYRCKCLTNIQSEGKFEFLIQLIGLLIYIMGFFSLGMLRKHVPKMLFFW